MRNQAAKALDRARGNYRNYPTYHNLCALERAERNYEKAFS